MKKIILVILTCLFSVSCFSQTVYVGGSYFNKKWHTTEDCPELVGHKAVKATYQNAYANFFPCSTCAKDKDGNVIVPVDTIDYSINTDDIEYYNTNNKITESIDYNIKNEISNAGNYLKKSAICNYAAIGFTILGGAVAATYGSDQIALGDETATIIIAGVCGLAASVSEILAINYKYKAGKSLTIAAGKITYNF